MAAPTSSVDDLNRALRLYRRLLLRLLAIFFGGFALALLLAQLSPGLGTWVLVAMLALLLAEIWIDGRAIGKALDDPLLKTVPALGILSGMSIIAQRAHAMDMEWTGFFGPLRSTKR